MRILDISGNEVKKPDLSIGCLKNEKLFIQHHEAVESVDAVIENKITRYPNGGIDIDPIVVSPAVPGKDAWDEYEDIYRYIEYTPEQLEEMEKQRQEAENNSPATWAELAAAIQEGVNSV